MTINLELVHSLVKVIEDYDLPGVHNAKNDQIAPMFMTAPKNCIFPAAWKEYLTPTGE